MLYLVGWSCEHCAFLGFASGIHFVPEKQQKFWPSTGNLQIPSSLTTGMSETSQENPEDCKYLLDRVYRVSGAVQSDSAICTACECTNGVFKGQNAPGNIWDTRSAVPDLHHPPRHSNWQVI